MENRSLILKVTLFRGTHIFKIGIGPDKVSTRKHAATFRGAKYQGFFGCLSPMSHASETIKEFRYSSARMSKFFATIQPFFELSVLSEKLAKIFNPTNTMIYRLNI